MTHDHWATVRGGDVCGRGCAPRPLEPRKLRLFFLIIAEFSYPIRIDKVWWNDVFK